MSSCCGDETWSLGLGRFYRAVLYIYLSMGGIYDVRDLWDYTPSSNMVDTGRSEGTLSMQHQALGNGGCGSMLIRCYLRSVLLRQLDGVLSLLDRDRRSWRGDTGARRNGICNGECQEQQHGEVEELSDRLIFIYGRGYFRGICCIDAAGQTVLVLAGLQGRVVIAGMVRFVCFNFRLGGIVADAVTSRAG